MPALIEAQGKELARLPIVRMQDVLVARLIVREEAQRLGFIPQALTQICTAVSEITRNVLQHASAHGQLRVCEIKSEGGRTGLEIDVRDEGAGIADIERVLAGVSPGAGIPGCRKLMDTFEIRSGAGAGTAVTMIRWLPRAPG